MELKDELKLVSDAFGMSFDYEAAEAYAAKDAALSESLLKQKIKEVAQDNLLVKFLPDKFLGPDGKYVDRYGNPIVQAISGEDKTKAYWSAYVKNALGKAEKGGWSIKAKAEVIPIDSKDEWKRLERKAPEPVRTSEPVPAPVGRRFREDD